MDENPGSPIQDVPESGLEENQGSAPQQVKPARRGKGCLYWIGLVLLVLLAAFITLILTGVIYQAFGVRADERNFPPPGEMVDVGGYQLHLYCTGPQDSGNPTVILEALSGGMSSYWAWIQPEIAAVTRVCSYDRAGRGWSDPSPDPQTLAGTVNNLHTLLQNAGVTPPYVLVGHSIGGIYARRYAADYLQEVAGIVLIDSAHPDQFIRQPEILAETNAYLSQSAVFPLLARIGIFRLYFTRGGEIDFQDLPPRQHDEVAALWSSPEYFNSQRAEIVAREGIFADAHELGSLGDLPLGVVTQAAGEPGWAEMQDELASLSTNSLHVTVPGSSHASLAFNPEHARAASEVILKVLEAARTGGGVSSGGS